MKISTPRNPKSKTKNSNHNSKTNLNPNIKSNPIYRTLLKKL